MASGPAHVFQAQQAPACSIQRLFCGTRWPNRSVSISRVQTPCAAHELLAAFLDRMGVDMRCLPTRTLGFLFLWFSVSGVSAADFAIGLGTAILAAIASVRLMPCSDVPVNFAKCLEIAVRLPFQAFVAGTNIARRALHPALPLRPGFIRYASHLPEGSPRNAFAALVSMQPGSVPIATGRDDDFIVHCLDLDLPVGAALAADEARLRKALGLESARG
jgi:multicomponent Na+:H+ antiporter subunit E